MPEALTTDHALANATTVAMHHARKEPPCPACQAYVATLEGERRPHPSTDPVVLEKTIRVPGFDLPGPVYWRLAAKAEALEKSVVGYLILVAMLEGKTGVTRSKNVALVELQEKAELETEILAALKSNDDASDAKIGARFGVSHEHVRRIRTGHRIPSAKTRKDRRLDPKIRELAKAGKSDPQIAAALHVGVDYVGNRRAARNIAPGYRAKGSKKDG